MDESTEMRNAAIAMVSCSDWNEYTKKLREEGFMPGLVRMEVKGQEILRDDAGNITGMGFTGGTERIRVWVVGQVNLIKDSWQMQGVFRNQEKAEAACRDSSYFVGPMWVDESLSHELATEWLGAYFPIVNHLDPRLADANAMLETALRLQRPHSSATGIDPLDNPTEPQT